MNIVIHYHFEIIIHDFDITMDIMMFYHYEVIIHDFDVTLVSSFPQTHRILFCSMGFFVLFSPPVSLEPP